MNRHSPHLLLVVVCLVTFLSLAPCVFTAFAEEPEASVGEVETEGVDLERRIVRSEGEVLFVPEVLFKESTLEDLPLGDSRASLVRKMDWWRNPPDPPLNGSGVVPRCWMPSGVYRWPSRPIEPEPLLEYLSGLDALLLGTIEAVVVGWDVQDTEVVRMVYVEVDEMLRMETDVARSDSTLVGGQLLIRIEGGEFMVEDVPICTFGDPYRYDPVPGDQILVTARWWGGQEVLEPSLVLRVEGEVIRAGRKLVSDLPLATFRHIATKPPLITP